MGRGRTSCHRYYLHKHTTFKVFFVFVCLLKVGTSTHFSHFLVNDTFTSVGSELFLLGNTAYLISAHRSRRAKTRVPILDFKTSPLAQSLEEITNENLAEANRPYITLT